ncbi:serpin family protein [Pontibacter sp. 172403-2]|uniref:serpin family protein n=1 Tax=Pontibacter rufus TaxID=2791028 RepID=UPI0018AFB45F|nr:serpin family protein [Pontibacter sp. 172403-2]MBF9255177.1 serpin family protein [Pontibacter sp. 172403-2]
MQKNYIKSAVAAVIAALMVLSGCEPDAASPDNPPNLRPLTTQEAATVQSSNNFAFRSFAQLSEAEGAKNVFISPLSISMALTMAYNGAGSSTKEAMRQTLGFKLPTDEEINQSYKSLAGLLTGMDRKVTFTYANSLWHNRDYQLQAPFVKLNQTYFDATVQGLDFTSPTAKDQMNSWVKEKTNGKITGIIESTSADDVLFLINAIYFKGTWTYLFDKELTKPAPFYKEDGSTVSHDFMTTKKARYLYYQDDSKKLIDLPYGNGQFSMTLLVPTGQHTVDDVVQELNDESVSTWLAAADTSGVELHIPKFKLEYKTELNETLSALGMGIAFGDDADFSQMVVGDRPLQISEVMHKTFLEVNEEGTEAAAVTSVGFTTTSVGPPALKVNRPFVFLIREKSSNTILFIGKLMQP